MSAASPASRSPSERSPALDHPPVVAVRGFWLARAVHLLIHHRETARAGPEGRLARVGRLGRVGVGADGERPAALGGVVAHRPRGPQHPQVGTRPAHL
eukprot:3127130-Pyramimonas_sp.AAC.1